MDLEEATIEDIANELKTRPVMFVLPIVEETHRMSPDGFVFHSDTIDNAKAILFLQYAIELLRMAS